MRLLPDAKAVSLVVLGQFAVTVAREPVDVTRPQVRQFIALLAADADRLVSIDRIEEDLWPDSLPRSPKDQLNLIVHRARKLLADTGHQVIRRESDAFRLSLEDCEVDLDEWYRRVAAARRLAAAGRFQAAVDEFTAARALWNGEPFVGVEGSRALERERARIVQGLGDVDLDEAAALLAMGRHPAAARILGGASVREPLREDLARAWMLALHRSGRTAEGLHVAAQFRDSLREQLGASPSVSFDERERALLGPDRGGDQNPPSRAARPTGWRPSLVEAVVSRVRQELDSETPTSLVVAAPPRFGLSTFLARIVEGLTDATPEPIVHHIHLGAGIDHSLLRLVEGLDLPSGPVDAHELPLVVDAIAEQATETPLVIVVDDVEELDGWSRTLVESLAAWLPSRTALVVGTHARSSSGGSYDDEWTYVLEPFDVVDTERLVREVVPQLSVDARLRVADRVSAWCCGEPATTQVAIELVAEHGESAPLPLRPDDSERVESKLRTLDEPCRDLVTKGAVLGAGLDCLLLAELTSESTEVIVGRIGLAAAAGLVTRASKPGWWVFVDAQTREVLASHVDETTAHSLHLGAAHALLAHREPRAQAALHLLEALPLGDPTTAARTAAAGGLELLRDHRYETAAFLCRNAADLLADPTAAVEARLGEALALERLGDHARADEIYDRIVAERAAGDDELLARAALGGAGRTGRIGGQPQRRRRLGHAYRRLSEGDPYADEVTAELALEQLSSGVPSEPGVWERLLHIAEDGASPGQLLALRMVLVVTENAGPPDLEAASRLADLALSRDRATGAQHVGAALSVVCRHFLVAGGWGKAEILIDEFELYGRRSGDPRSRWQAVAFRAALTEARGAHAAADALVDDARQLGARLGIADGEAAYALHHLGRAFRAGSLATFAPILGGIEERYRLPVWHALRGLAELDDGSTTAARSLLREARHGLEHVRDFFRPPAIALTCLLAARLTQTWEVEDLRSDLDARSGGFVFVGYGGPFLGPVDWFRAQLYRADQDLARAAELDASAREVCRREGALFESRSV